jgi:decaprenylphospho-beta-D-erythro-pentofuranosid-2-ulose 2-reductase
MENVVIFGATSAIAQGAAKVFAARGASLTLVARNEIKLQAVKQDLEARGARAVHTLVSDLNDLEAHVSLISQVDAVMGGISVALIAHGTLGDQKAAEREFPVALRELTTNFLSAASLLTLLGNRFEAQRSGKIIVIGSVAGDRGRQSNYVYGCAKGATALFAAGLRNRLAKSGVQVLTVKPGFVDSPMTAHLPKGPLFASADTVGAGIVHALDKGRNVVYLPWFWCGIMAIIRSIPEAIFKRLSL